MADDLSVSTPRHLLVGASTAKVRVEWHEDWSSPVSEAFSVLPYDHLMDAVLVRRLWEDGVGRDRQKIALVRSLSGEPVGVVPLRKRGKLSWQLLTHYVMPYARFFVLPQYTDAALDVLGRDIDCFRVSFSQVPANTRMLRPEESWVVPLKPTYDELLRRTRYREKDRKFRRETARMDLREDDYGSLPEALDHWQRKWLSEGSLATACRKSDLLLGFEVLAEQGRLKTFSLHDGDTLVAMGVGMIGPGILYAVLKMMREEYRRNHAGIRLTLAAMEWACEHGMVEYDMVTTGGQFKRQWAQPEVRGYRLVRRPFGSETLGWAIESSKDVLWRLRHKGE